MSDQTPKPELLKAAEDLRAQRPWVFYRLEYDDLKRMANQVADQRDTITARCEALEQEQTRLRKALNILKQRLGEMTDFAAASVVKEA